MPLFLLLNFLQTIETIGDESFYGSNIDKIILPVNLSEIKDGAFHYLTCYTLDFSQCDLLTSLRDELFTECHITNLILPTGITSIPEFLSYSTVTKLDFGNSPINTINSNAFLDSNISTILWTVTELSKIEPNAFHGLRIKSLDLSQGTFRILEADVFNNAKIAESLKLPSGITFVGASAFSECEIGSLLWDGSKLTSIGMFAFESSTIPELDLLNATLLTTLSFSNFSKCQL